jgi:hypothetical protein
MPWRTISLTRREIAEFAATRRRRSRFLVDENLGSGLHGCFVHQAGMQREPES